MARALLFDVSMFTSVTTATRAKLSLLPVLPQSCRILFFFLSHIVDLTWPVTDRPLQKETQTIWNLHLH